MVCSFASSEGLLNNFTYLSLSSDKCSLPTPPPLFCQNTWQAILYKVHQADKGQLDSILTAANLRNKHSLSVPALLFEFGNTLQIKSLTHSPFGIGIEFTEIVIFF